VKADFIRCAVTRDRKKKERDPAGLSIISHSQKRALEKSSRSRVLAHEEKVSHLGLRASKKRERSTGVRTKKKKKSVVRGGKGRGPEPKGKNESSFAP